MVLSNPTNRSTPCSDCAALFEALGGRPGEPHQYQVLVRSQEGLAFYKCLVCDTQMTKVQTGASGHVVHPLGLKGSEFAH